MFISASSSLSSEAREILYAESEKFVKLLLRFQQHRFGEQAGALRYMESLRLIWNTVGRVQKYHELITYFDIVLNNGVLDTYSPKIMKSMCWQTLSFCEHILLRRLRIRLLQTIDSGLFESEWIQQFHTSFDSLHQSYHLSKRIRQSDHWTLSYGQKWQELRIFRTYLWIFGHKFLDNYRIFFMLIW